MSTSPKGMIIHCRLPATRVGERIEKKIQSKSQRNKMGPKKKNKKKKQKKKKRERVKESGKENYELTFFWASLCIRATHVSSHPARTDLNLS